ncbi:DUF5615 family PIN-like protein [Candidatus Woesearchaeota archaeon]|nr:DUF5615 family PIN-like protein [Candidatus Woesearchaeota archaeon]
MKIRFLLDQNISPKVAAHIKKIGYGALELHEVGLRGKEDEEIYEFARTNNFIIVTFDHEFGFSFLSRKNLAGLVILRIHPQTYDRVVGTLDRALNKLSPSHFLGNIVVIQKNKIRIRKVKKV